MAWTPPLVGGGVAMLEGVEPFSVGDLYTCVVVGVKEAVGGAGLLGDLSGSVTASRDSLWLPDLGELGVEVGAVSWMASIPVDW